jgi:hypothetical protein
VPGFGAAAAAHHLSQFLLLLKGWLARRVLGAVDVVDIHFAFHEAEVDQLG